MVILGPLLKWLVVSGYRLALLSGEHLSSYADLGFLEVAHLLLVLQELIELDRVE